MPGYKGGNPLMKKGKGGMSGKKRGVGAVTMRSKGGKDARDSESYRKDAMVRKGVKNHVSA